MRIWDIHPARLCRYHLLGEHRELHALWTILTENRSGYRSHPETRRWEGKLPALYERHELLVQEMLRRGYNHNSPLDAKLARGEVHAPGLLISVLDQERLLRAKGCECSKLLNSAAGELQVKQADD